MESIPALLAASRALQAAVSVLNVLQSGDRPAGDLTILGKSWLQLWAATTKESVDAVMSNADLQGLMIAFHAGRQTDRLLLEAPTAAGLPLPVEIVIPKVAAARTEEAIFRGDLGVALFALAVAIVTGMSRYYWDKDFGRPTEYASLFLWAIGTKLAADMFTGLLDRLEPLLNVVGLRKS